MSLLGYTEDRTPIVGALRRRSYQRGVGDVLVIDCPFCGDVHTHGAGSGEPGTGGGYRASHCRRREVGGEGYFLRETGIEPASRMPSSWAGRPSPRAARASRAAIPVALRSRVLERDGFRCRRCGNTADDGVRLVLDHICPVSDGGETSPANLQTLCEPCNAGKAARDPHPHDLRPFGGQEIG